MKLIVTGCWIKSGGLYVLDTETGKCLELMTEHVRGVAVDGDVLYLTRTNSIEAWNLSPLSLEWFEDHTGAEPHDIHVKGEDLYVSLTAQNRIVRRPISGNKWLPDFVMHRDQERDVCHLNSFDFLPDGRAVGTAFTADRLNRQKWRDVGAEGFVFVTNGDESYTILKHGLSQPHSLRTTDGMLSYCDSRQETLYSGRGSRFVGGYLRGLHVTEEKIYVGRSRTRFESDDGPDRRFSCAVIEIDRKDGNVRVFEIPTIEIYDIIEVPE